MLPQKDINQIREELEGSNRPVFFFHGDADGLCSFLLFYRFIKRGKGFAIKTTPRVTKKIYAKKVREYNADKVFVLDLAEVDQDFIDEVKIPVIWIDHHPMTVRNNVQYYNSRAYDSIEPPSSICYEVTKHDIWIAVCGCIGDWYMPTFFEKFRQDYPDSVEEGLTKPEDILFKSLLGKLVLILWFNLKGTTNDTADSVKVLTRINSPLEILNQTTPAGRYIYRKYEKVNSVYEKLKQNILKMKDEKVLVFVYSAKKYSLTTNLSNEMTYLFPDKIILLGRKKGDEIKLSLRRGNNHQVNLVEVLEKALVGVEGFGGGHEFTCGANVKERDFDKFIQNFKRELKEKYAIES